MLLPNAGLQIFRWAQVEQLLSRATLVLTSAEQVGIDFMSDRDKILVPIYLLLRHFSRGSNIFLIWTLQILHFFPSAWTVLVCFRVVIQHLVAVDLDQ